jgi:hypothetical protein
VRAAGAPASPLIRQYAFLLDKARLAPQVAYGWHGQISVQIKPWRPSNQRRSFRNSDSGASSPAQPDGPAIEVPLIRLAWARSGRQGRQLQHRRDRAQARAAAACCARS